MAGSQTRKPLAWLASTMPGSTKIGISQKLWPLLVCILATAAALGIDLAVGTISTDAAGALYIMAAAVSAYVGSFRFGLLSVFLATLPNIWLYNSGDYSMAVVRFGWERIFFNSFIGAVLAWVVASLSKEKAALETLNDELECRVEERTADLEESNRQLEAFCYTLAHDLRAPLRAIQGFSQITIAEYAQQIGPEPTETLTRISTSAEMMGRLIHDLLVYTQLHRAEIPLGETSLQQVVERVLQILDPEIHRKHASVEVIAPLPSVTANFVLTEQILLCLVSNALTFTRDNVEPHIRISHERSRSSVRLSIQDNGPGIASHYLNRIFEPFQRLNLEQTRGTGMGLAFAKKGVERLGGKIGVESKLNGGSCFWIELPP